MANSNLDDLLDELAEEGSVESQGRFTLSSEKLRQKLGAYQFERPSQWVLKVIQALVLAKVNSCDILQSHGRTLFYIQSSQDSFDFEELESAFYDPEQESSAAVKHLTVALWFLSFNLQLGWLWRACNSEVGLAWTGTELQTVAIEVSPDCSLEISHNQRKSEDHWWSDLLSDLRLSGPSGCAETSRELTLNAYTCPFPLSLDSRRIDNLLECPSITQAEHVSKNSILDPQNGAVCVASMGWGKAEGPVVDLPPGTFVGPSASELVETSCLTDYPSGAAWIALLLANLKDTRSGNRSRGWGPENVSSRVTWIRHGVVVAECQLPTNSPASCQLFVSADALKSDLSGLKLVEGQTQLPSDIRDAVAEWLGRQTISFSPVRQSQLDTANAWTFLFAIFQGNAILDAGASLDGGRILFAGLSFLGMAGFARFAALLAGNSESLEETFKAELSKLVQEWVLCCENSGHLNKDGSPHQ